MLQVLPRTRRGHSLPGRIPRDALYTACKAVKRPRGAVGLDKQALQRGEANLEANLLALMRALQAGTYQPLRRRRGYSPQGKGGVRPLGLPTVRGRVAQEGSRAVLEPIFAATLQDSSQGFWRHRSGHTAMVHLVEWHQQGSRVVVDAARTGGLESIPHQLILDLGARERADGHIWRLSKKWRQAGVREEGEGRPTRQGTPQGGVGTLPTKLPTCW